MFCIGGESLWRGEAVGEAGGTKGPRQTYSTADIGRMYMGVAFVACFGPQVEGG